jgi:spore maturation protein CgeB
MRPLKITILGLSITSSWGNGHATTFRALIRALAAQGHQIHFLERDVPWYAAHRDCENFPGCTIELYDSLEQLRSRHEALVGESDVVIVGSYVPDGVAVGDWVLSVSDGLCAFYDIDTPITLTALDQYECSYLSPAQIRRYDLYLSFSGGQALDILSNVHGSPCARPLYCSVDPEQYFPTDTVQEFELGYLGTYSPDRQPTLQRLLIDVARRDRNGSYIVAGPQYPAEIRWHRNIVRIDHLPPALHRAFYNSQSFTLNVTRADMIRLGHSPSVRLFEAAACATPIITDPWVGLHEFFMPGEEIWVAESTEAVLYALREMDDEQRMWLGELARQRVLSAHTADHRAAELVQYIREAETIKSRQHRVPHSARPSATARSHS